MIAFTFFCVSFLCLASYQIGRIIGRNEITPEDKLWKNRIDTGYGPR